MDATERTRTPPLSSERRGPVSRIPSLLLWGLLAAAVFWLASALTQRGRRDEAEGLVRWRTRDAAVAGARREGKPILYDFTAAWCPPCHRLDAEGWGDSRIAGIVNDWYVPARIVDRQREEGGNAHGIDELQRRYKIVAFPTLIVTDSSGREVARSEGYAGRERLVRFLEASKGPLRSP